MPLDASTPSKSLGRARGVRSRKRPAKRPPGREPADDAELTSLGPSGGAALAGFAYCPDRRPGGLSDLALGPVGIAGDLEVDDGGRAQLGAVGVADALTAGVLDGLLHRALATADEAVVEALLLDPVRRRRGPEALGPAARHLAARAGELDDV